MTKTTTETTMTEVDMMFQVASRRIQGLTEKVNHWKRRANELEAALGVEKAARLEAEATLSRALNSWGGQISKPDRDALAAQVRRLESVIDGIRNSLKLDDGDDVRQGVKNHVKYSAEESAYWRGLHQEAMGALAQEREHREKERDGLTTQVQDMRNEIARLRADLRDMSDRSNGSEWEKKAVELEELRAELNLVKQERDCAKSEWDRAEGRCKTLGGEVAEMFSDRQRLKAELAVIKDERNELRAKLEAIEAESRGCYEELSKIRRNALSCEPSAPTLRSHPVKVGEWVKNDNGDVRQVREVYAEYLLTTGWRWAFDDCTPCDPPEASHDTPAGKETAQAAVTPQPGDAVRLVRFPTPKECREWSDEFGKIGELATVISDDDEPCPFCVSVVRSEGCIDWPLSCIEIVK